MWVLALRRWFVAMPFAGGPLAYRAVPGVGPAFGFIMGWLVDVLAGGCCSPPSRNGHRHGRLSSFTRSISSIHHTDGQILAALQPIFCSPSKRKTASPQPSRWPRWGSSSPSCMDRQQCQVDSMEWMPLVIHRTVWFLHLHRRSMDRTPPAPALTDGWSGVLKAIPYAIAVSGHDLSNGRSPEEARAAAQTIPRSTPAMGPGHIKIHAGDRDLDGFVCGRAATSVLLTSDVLTASVVLTGRFLSPKTCIHLASHCRYFGEHLQRMITA